MVDWSFGAVLALPGSCEKEDHAAILLHTASAFLTIKDVVNTFMVQWLPDDQWRPAVDAIRFEESLYYLRIADPIPDTYFLEGSLRVSGSDPVVSTPVAGRDRWARYWD